MGTMRWANGNQYVGEWFMGRACGYGELKVVEEWRRQGTCTKVGYFKNDRMHGEGKIMYSGGPKAGRIIEGQFKHGQWHGLMYVQSENGDKKFCEFVEDKAHGFGLNEYEAGGEYQGEFHNDKKHGYAVYRNK